MSHIMYYTCMGSIMDTEELVIQEHKALIDKVFTVILC